MHYLWCILLPHVCSPKYQVKMHLVHSCIRRSFLSLIYIVSGFGNNWGINQMTRSAGCVREYSSSECWIWNGHDFFSPDKIVWHFRSSYRQKVNRVWAVLLDDPSGGTRLTEWGDHPTWGWRGCETWSSSCSLPPLSPPRKWPHRTSSSSAWVWHIKLKWNAPGFKMTH